MPYSACSSALTAIESIGWTAVVARNGGAAWHLDCPSSSSTAPLVIASLVWPAHNYPLAKLRWTSR